MRHFCNTRDLCLPTQVATIRYIFSTRISQINKNVPDFDFLIILQGKIANINFHIIYQFTN